MITRIEIQDYRSCIKTVFEPQKDLSILIGPNSSGKTNILNAIQLLRKLTTESYYYERDDYQITNQCKLKVWFKIGDKKAIFNAMIDIYTDENNEDIIVKSKQYWYMKDFTGNKKRIKLPLDDARDSNVFYSLEKNKRFYIRSKNRQYLYHWPDMNIDKEREVAVRIINKIAKDLNEMRYYSASRFTNPSSCPVSFEIEKEGKRSRGISLRGHTKFLYDLYNIFKNSSKIYTEFFEIIGPNGIGLVNEIKFHEIQTSSVEYSVKSGGRWNKRSKEKLLIIPQFLIGKNILSPNQLSDGTFKTITLLFYLITESSNVLLIEEPEVCVHQGLLASIIELIKNYASDKQIIVSTHSDFVLDKVEPENVYRVSNSVDSGTQVFHVPRTMSRRELKALKEYLKSDGNLGEYWRHGGFE